jgi:hypothetical protein
MLDTQFLTNLIHQDDPLAVIWEHMLHLYTPAEWPADLRAFMDDREEALNRLEQAVYEGYFEAYDLLLERAQAQTAEYALSLFERCPLVVVVDSMSVREAVLLQARGTSEVSKTSEVCLRVAPWPPVTASLATMLLGTGSPAGGRDTDRFRYRYVAGPEQIPDLPASGPLLVWVRLPDTALEQVTQAQTHTVAGAFEKMAETLRRVLERSGRDQALLTSDHGYLYARNPNQYWLMPTGVENAARNAFPRESRVQPSSGERAQGLRHQESPQRERRFFAFGGEHVAVRGRYWWGTASPNDRCTAHGGLSFVECLVPVVLVRRYA